MFFKARIAPVTKFTEACACILSAASSQTRRIQEDVTLQYTKLTDHMHARTDSSLDYLVDWAAVCDRNMRACFSTTSAIFAAVHLNGTVTLCKLPSTDIVWQNVIDGLHGRATPEYVYASYNLLCTLSETRLVVEDCKHGLIAMLNAWRSSD